jgi:DNA-binding MarR family transcriptional regulator
VSKHELMQRIADEMRAYGRANDEVDEIATESIGVNRTDGRCIDLLEERGPQTAGALAKLTGLTTGAITTAVDRLERVGLARRVADEHDRRKVMVELTPKALAMCHATYGPLAERGFAIMERYTVAELDVILDFLQRGRALVEERANELRAVMPPSGAPGAP